MTVYYGAACSDGIGIGPAVIAGKNEIDVSGAVFTDVATEKKRLGGALNEFSAQTEKMILDAEQNHSREQADILSGQLAMAGDPYMLQEISGRIDEKKPAETAFVEVCDVFTQMFLSADDELMRQRAADINDIKDRVLRIMLGESGRDFSAAAPGSVIVAHELTPSMMSLLPQNTAGIASAVGGRTSHSAILARAMGIPAVYGFEDDKQNIKDGDTVIIDGFGGRIIVDPDDVTLQKFKLEREKELLKKQELQRYKDVKTVTADGAKLLVYANIGSAQEAAAASESGCEGIGLFRTEFLFMDRAAAPDEEEQLCAYSQAARASGGNEVIIRTLDVGGDKEIPYLKMEKEENPFLGHRAIRYCLGEEDIFKTQLKAILRAGADHNVKIMLPLVTTLCEIKAAKAAIDRAKEELRRENKRFSDSVPVGIMVETPAAAVMADIFAEHVDFFSIGTNDLTQYTMAADRGNSRVSELYSPFDPAVLRLIKSVVASAKRAGIPAGMCGEAAADPLLIPLLLSFGLDEFSVSPSSVLKTRKIISEWHKKDADALAQRVMSLSTADEIKAALAAAAEQRRG